MDKTRLIRQGLEEARSMLADVAGEPAAARLAKRLEQIEERLDSWSIQPPNRMDRAATINDVVALKMDVSQLRTERISGVIPRGAIPLPSTPPVTKAR